MTKKLYAQRDHIEQGQNYVDHVSAMTGEGLHSKSDIAGELAHRDIMIDRFKIRVKNDKETLRGIVKIGDDAERMKLWAKDALSGYIEPFESSLLKAQDEAIKLRAENERLRDALLSASNSMREFVGSFYQRQDVMEPLKKIEVAASEASKILEGQ